MVAPVLCTMTAVYNVNRSVEDPFYRYKMPAVIAKVEGKGNGVKTVIPNMSDIAKALDRPPSYPTKYFGIELGAQTKMDEKNDRYIVNGAFTSEDLQSHLDGFIQKFVLCPSCENPETDLQVSKKNIRQVCTACGHSGPLKHVTHRLYNYILTHPPKKTAKKGKKKAEDNKSAGEGAENNQEATLRGDIDAPELDPERDDEDEEWSADISEEAIRKREESQITGAVSKLVASADADRPLNERVDILHGFVKERVGKDPYPAKEVLDKAQVLDVMDASGVVLVEVLLDQDNFIPLLRKYQDVFQLFCTDRPKVQRRVLNGVEIKLKDRDIPFKQMPNVLNALYQLDIVDEESFYAWHRKVSKRFVDKATSRELREAAQPFIDWLQEAESEEEEEAEDEGEEAEAEGGAGEASDAEGDDTIQFSQAAVPNGNAGPAAGQDEDGDDIDIDAI